jgi:hypothetical protein
VIPIFEREGNALKELMSKSGTDGESLSISSNSSYEALSASSSSR